MPDQVLITKSFSFIKSLLPLLVPYNIAMSTVPRQNQSMALFRSILDELYRIKHIMKRIIYIGTCTRFRSSSVLTGCAIRGLAFINCTSMPMPAYHQISENKIMASTPMIQSVVCNFAGQLRFWHLQRKNTFPAYVSQISPAWRIIHTGVRSSA